MPRNERHVVRGDNGWKVVKPGSSRASATAKTQREADKISKRILGNDGGGESVVHRPNGRIRSSDTVAPGNDPFPPKG